VAQKTFLMNMKINKVLIANRSEIACRIIRACKELGKLTVAVYSDADKDALHVQLADESVYIGESSPLKSYLNVDKIINAAKECNADAIHPGYGFLSENPLFCKRVNDEGLIFIGPSQSSMERLGSKIEARLLMQNSGVPVVPGMSQSSDDIEEYVKNAAQIGYPILIKASAGGGGKGMRVVRSEAELRENVVLAKSESKSAFNSDEVFLEKYLEKPRHIEFQIAADKHGNYIHLFERECSIQRRHQKIIEEAPSVALNAELRNRMGKAAIDAVKSVNYDSVGTVEFLLDENQNFYFLEVNTRIQVEHPVTESITGVDLVKLQIAIAEGQELPYTQQQISSRGHSIECRIYAEDGANNFMPSTGKILKLIEPKGVGIRYDAGVFEGYTVTPDYDPILAKLIVWGENREDARKKMINALNNHILLGVKTSVGFMRRALETEDFANGTTFTNFIAQNESNLYFSYKESEIGALLAIGNVSAAEINSNYESNFVSNANYDAKYVDFDPWLHLGKVII